ncbi:glutathione hydrolase 7 isoform X2 [Aethina tumida]|uniref:glutathione hydrolase 7 isoform X2 n=1 Tax=Aethina tumida TaxID=116153 RepID=UPI0021494585|nr:glutathione hydrolase 7 isoform X2 [Aethina tumida]
MTTIGAETREDIPLKSGTKSTSLCICNEDCLGGSRFINISFGTLTFVITIALVVQIYYGDYQVIPHGSVATDNFNCSKIGTSILKENGNAVDAAIASAICLAVTNPHVTGLDAEGQILIYNHRSRNTPVIIDFTGTNVVSEHLPKLILGLAYIHIEYGNIEWKKLIQPSVDIARYGFRVQKVLLQAIKAAKLEDLFPRIENDQILVLEALAETLEKIANIPESELSSYITITNEPSHFEAVKSTFSNYDVFVPNIPSAGPSLLANLERIEKLNYSNNISAAEYVYRIAESTEQIYSELNITSKFEEGTSSNIAVMDLHDNYVSLITGMTALFGSKELTSGGYFFDGNLGHKHASRIPIILTDANVICGRRIVFGANDISTATQLITSLVVSKQNATESVEAPRFHILSQGGLGLEDFPAPSFNDEALKYLNTLSQPIVLQEPYSSSNIVEKVKDDLSSHSDSRGGGIASRF